jgi:hypothetical protein
MQKVSTYKDEHMMQITLCADGTERRALLTLHKGKRMWAVRGRKENADGVYSLRLAESVRKSDALNIAKMFIEFNVY